MPALDSTPLPLPALSEARAASRAASPGSASFIPRCRTVSGPLQTRFALAGSPAAAPRGTRSSRCKRQQVVKRRRTGCAPTTAGARGTEATLVNLQSRNLRDMVRDRAQRDKRPLPFADVVDTRRTAHKHRASPARCQSARLCSAAARARRRAHRSRPPGPVRVTSLPGQRGEREVGGR